MLSLPQTLYFCVSLQLSAGTMGSAGGKTLMRHNPFHLVEMAPLVQQNNSQNIAEAKTQQARRRRGNACAVEIEIGAVAENVREMFPIVGKVAQYRGGDV